MVSNSSSSSSDESLSDMSFDDVEYFSFKGQTRRAKIVKCYDGDTAYAIFKHDGKYQKFKLRLSNFDSPEIRPSRKIPTEERNKIKEDAKASKKALEKQILDKKVYLICDEFDKYGRILCEIKVNKNDKQTVNEYMVQNGYGKPYFGGTK